MDVYTVHSVESNTISFVVGCVGVFLGKQMLLIFSLHDACLFFETIFPSLPTMK